MLGGCLRLHPLVLQGLEQFVRRVLPQQVLRESPGMVVAVAHPLQPVLDQQLLEPQVEPARWVPHWQTPELLLAACLPPLPALPVLTWVTAPPLLPLLLPPSRAQPQARPAPLHPCPQPTAQGLLRCCLKARGLPAAVARVFAVAAVVAAAPLQGD